MGGTTSGGMGGVGAVAGTGGVAACAGSTKQVTAQLSGDTNIFPDNTVAKPACSTSITYGTAPVISVGAVEDNASRTLLRFQLIGEMMPALSTSKVQSARVVLHRALGAACAGTCPVKTGTVQVFPLTKDWVAGTNGSKDGATWCYGNLTPTGPQMAWEQNGAMGTTKDLGPLAGKQKFNGTDQVLTIDLDPVQLLTKSNLDASLSLLLAPDPTDSPQFFLYSKENGDPSLAPSLIFDICQ